VHFSQPRFSTEHILNLENSALNKAEFFSSGRKRLLGPNEKKHSKDIFGFVNGENCSQITKMMTIINGLLFYGRKKRILCRGKLCGDCGELMLILSENFGTFFAHHNKNTV
jgi:hypothetical protein